MEVLLKERIRLIDGLIERMRREKEVSIVEILKEEIDKLKRLNEDYESALQRKSVCRKEEAEGKTKYLLSDGSIYVANRAKGYKYLYDSLTSVVTYEFTNGQIERTFPGGIKEIRSPNGKIVIKTPDKEYDIVRDKIDLK